jgi:Ran GTPase-activating protein (RanGAP) involved in mRNA processing and transport
LIEDNGAQALSEALKTNSTLTTLDLSYTSIGSNGAQALSEVLKTNWTLTIIGVSDLTKYSKQ